MRASVKTALVLIAFAVAGWSSLAAVRAFSRPDTPPDEARELEQRVAAGTATPETMVRLGELYLLRGQDLKAAEMAFTAWKASPQEPGPNNLLGVLYVQSGQRDKARKSFIRAIAADPARVQPRMNLARLELDEKRPREALLQLQHAARSEPDNARIWLLVGQAQRMFGSHVAANASFKRALRLSPGLAEAHVQLGIMHVDFDRPSQAVPEFEAAYRLGEREPITLSYYALALMCARASDADAQKATQLLAEAKHPDVPPAWFAQGILHKREGKHQGARRMFEKVLEADPGQERALYMLAESQRLLGDPSGAARTLTRYHKTVLRRQTILTLSDRLRQEGAQPALLRDYGAALLEAGRLEDAETQFKRWAALRPKDPQPKVWLSRVRQARLQGAAQNS